MLPSLKGSWSTILRNARFALSDVAAAHDAIESGKLISIVIIDLERRMAESCERSLGQNLISSY
jgi:hypothetical protein